MKFSTFISYPVAVQAAQCSALKPASSPQPRLIGLLAQQGPSQGAPLFPQSPANQSWGRLSCPFEGLAGLGGV